MIDRKDVFEFEMIQYCDKENLRTILIYYLILGVRSGVLPFYGFTIKQPREGSLVLTLLNTGFKCYASSPMNVSKP
ncbi:MAG: hypothetical protein AAGC64_05580 [Bacteroidota bacterium]